MHCHYVYYSMHHFIRNPACNYRELTHSFFHSEHAISAFTLAFVSKARYLKKEHTYFDSPVFPSSSAKYGSLRSTSDGISSSLISFSAVACNKAETLFQPTYQLQKFHWNKCSFCQKL